MQATGNTQAEVETESQFFRWFRQNLASGSPELVLTGTYARFWPPREDGDLFDMDAIHRAFQREFPYWSPGSSCEKSI